jgi:DNA-binding winged helix-turn-helix (wHTH) protein/Tfp pilus assembly protein PilF
VGARRYRFGSFQLDTETGELRKDGRRLRFPGRASRALTALLENPGALVPREELRKRVWPSEVHVEFEHGLNNVVHRIRQTLGDAAGLIETVPGRGYRFLGEVERIALRPTPRPSRLYPLAALAVLVLAILVLWVATRSGIDPKAREALLRGDYFFAQKTPEGLKKSLASFEEAASLAPEVAAAHAGLARAHHFLGAVGVIDRAEALERTTLEATRALELDPACGSALAILAESRFRFADRRDGVESLFQRALRLEPDSADIHQWYGNFLALSGRLDEGLAQMERARSLDPLSLHINSDYAVLLYESGDRDGAMRVFARTLELDPGYSKTHFFLGQIYLAEGKREQALRSFERSLSLAPDVPKYQAAYAKALARSR